MRVNELTMGGGCPHITMSAGRAAASDLAVRGGKSGLHGNTVPDNVRRGRPQGQRHRKQTAPGCVPGVRVKGCGKSAPRTRQRGRHGKPHREQNRIGTTGALVERRRPVSRPVVRVGCLRRSATTVPEEWPPRPGFSSWAIQNPAYRPADAFFSLPSFQDGPKGPAVGWPVTSSGPSLVACEASDPNCIRHASLAIALIHRHGVFNHRPRSANAEKGRRSLPFVNPEHV